MKGDTGPSKKIKINGVESDYKDIFSQANRSSVTIVSEEI
jgi:hypothetical protein